MSIKLLAIRPLEGCDDKFLKNLKPNCIYRFYNEYEYLDLDNKKINDKISDKEVSFIIKNQEIPDNFYAKNINISAVVGANGSGKSGLFDLIYAFNFNLSKKFNIENFNDFDIEFCKINIELFFKEIIANQTYYYKIIHKFEEQKFKFFQAENLFPFNFKTEEYSSSDWKKFYYLGINYSLYGLNSLVNGNWVKKIFHKNDGYQSPISINPFRTDGCIDVNNEFNLAQSRLILSEYILKDKQLLEGINLNNIEYSINLKNIQYVKDEPLNKERLLIKEIIDFNSLVFPNNNDLNELVNTILKGITNIRPLYSYIEKCVTEDFFISQIGFEYINKSEAKFILSKTSLLELEIDLLIKRLYSTNDNISINKLENITPDFKDKFYKILIDKQSVNLQYLCFLYIFKKLKKITNNYSEYKKFNFLFNEEFNLSDQLWTQINKNKESIINKFFDENIDYENHISINRINSLTFEEIENIKNGIIINSIIFFESLGFNYDELNRNIEINFNNILKYCDINNQNILNEYQFFNIIYDAFMNIINNNRSKIFIRFIDEIYDDESHITFKLKQVLGYFKHNIFKHIGEINNDELIYDELIYKIDIKEDYYKGKNLAEVPLTFFNPKINITKNKSVYSFNRLSSGEQQMIHSLLNIKYHLFNLQSIKKDNILKYRNINILFDEVELYFHPEYQRSYISELIKHLEKLKEFNFNILFATHSPFILSDIPSQNVLKLKEGNPIPDKDGINSFGSNIHNLLADEFFLKNGFMGEFASAKIQELIQNIKYGEPINEIKYKKYLQEIELIGEKVLKIPLLELLEEKREINKLPKIDLIAFYQKQIEKIKKNENRRNKI